MIHSNYILLLLLILSFSVNAQQKSSNKTDSLGRKQGFWIYYGKDRPKYGYDSEAKIEEGYYVDNRKDSIWTKFHKDGITPKIQATYQNNRPNGSFKKFFADGSLMESGSFQKGKYIGPHSRWYSNGNRKFYADADSTVYWYENGCREYLFLHDSVKHRTISYTYLKDSCDRIKDSSTMTYSPSVQKELSEKYAPFKESIACTFEPEPSKRSIRTEKFQKEHPIYTDSSICNCNEVSGNRIKCYNTEKELYFMGKCTETGVSGRFYFYDEDGILLRVEIWRDSKFREVGIP